MMCANCGKYIDNHNYVHNEQARVEGEMTSELRGRFWPTVTGDLMFWDCWNDRFVYVPNREGVE